MKYIKHLTVILLLISLRPMLAQAQSKSLTIYQIQVAAYSDEIDWSKYKKLTDLGIVSSQSLQENPPQDQLTRIFLGKYLNEATALKVAQEVKARGFSVSYEKVALTEGFSHTIQLGVFSRLDLQRFITVEYLSNLYIKLENNQYRVFYGFYENESYAENALNVLKSQGVDGVVKPL